MLTLRGRRHGIQELAFSHCGRWLAAAGHYGGVHVWDTQNPAAPPRHTDLGQQFWTGGLAFRPDGRLFCRDYHHNWFLFGPGAELTPLARPDTTGWFHPTPDALHAIRAEHPVKLEYFTLPTGGEEAKRVWTTKAAPREAASVAFSPDGTAFTSAEWHGNTRVVVVRDAATGATRHELSLPTSVALHLAFAAGGLLVGRYGASLFCWNLAQPDEKPRKATNPSRKHFQSMTVHPGGAVLTVDNNRVVRVWDVPSLNPYREIEWNVGKLYAVAVSLDGARAAVGSHTGRVLVWDWD